MEPKPTQTRVQSRNLLGVLAFLRAYPAPVVLSVSLLLVNIAVELSLPQILGSAITQLRWHIEWGAPLDLRAGVLLFVSLVLVRAGNGILLGPIRNRLIQRTLGDIRAAIYDSLQRLAFRYHDQSNTGELISRSTTDVLRLQDFLFACLFLIFDIAVALVLTVALIFATSAALGVLTLLTLVPTIALIAFFAGKLQPQWRKVHDLHGAMTTVIQENIAGVRVVKAFAKESAEVKKFRDRKELFLGTLLDTELLGRARAVRAIHLRAGFAAGTMDRRPTSHSGRLADRRPGQSCVLFDGHRPSRRHGRPVHQHHPECRRQRGAHPRNHPRTAGHQGRQA